MSGDITHQLDHPMHTSDGREVPVTGVRFEGQGPVRAEPPADALFAESPGVQMVFDHDLWLQERLAFWQRQLRLLDWDITAEFSTYNEMQGRSGLLWHNEESKEARIRILGRAEWPSPSTAYGTWDEEAFLLHELFHLFYLHWDTSEDKEDPIYIAKEQAVDLLATALLRLARGEPR